MKHSAINKFKKDAIDYNLESLGIDMHFGLQNKGYIDFLGFIIEISINNNGQYIVTLDAVDIKAVKVLNSVEDLKSSVLAELLTEIL